LDPAAAAVKLRSTALPTSSGLERRFTGKDGLKSADRFAGAEWSTRASGVPLLAGALAAIDCGVEEIVERHSHAIIIGRVLDVEVSARSAALAYWHGQYVAIDRDRGCAPARRAQRPDPACCALDPEGCVARAR
jgi:flavin reductase (DIM6/NTAB) family NADH-FMN oxidoreductase RutF